MTHLDDDGQPGTRVCPTCEKVVESPNTIHVIRACEQCGREMRVFEPGDHGRGMRVRPGDRPVIPPEALQMSLNPLKSKAHFSRAGVHWFWERASVGNLPRMKDQMFQAIKDARSEYEAILRASTLLANHSFDSEEGTLAAVEFLGDRRDSAEWWCLHADIFAAVAQDAVAEGDAERAAWAMGCSERFRSMFLFKANLEEVVWMGQSAQRLLELLRLWAAHSENSSEEFWQATFSESTYALSQVLGVPIVFIQDKAYVGGMSIDRSGGKFVDYLFAIESSGEAVAIEIKVPTAELLAKTPYREGVYRPSAELSGAIAQVLDYRYNLLRKLDSIVQSRGRFVEAFHPRCVLIFGHAKRELDTTEKRRSFELFRSSLKDVELITYDEIFKKLEILATLFGLVKQPSPSATNSDASIGDCSTPSTPLTTTER